MCLYNSRLLSDDAREPDSADICLYPPLTITQPLLYTDNWYNQMLQTFPLHTCTYGDGRSAEDNKDDGCPDMSLERDLSLTELGSTS